MTDFLIDIDEVMVVLHEDIKEKARKWLYRHGLQQFSRGKYVREQFEDVLNKRGTKCLQLGKEVNSTTSEERYVWGKKPTLSKNNLLDLIDSQMQESMQTN